MIGYPYLVNTIIRLSYMTKTQLPLYLGEVDTDLLYNDRVYNVSVADPGYVSRIQIFQFRIPDLGSKLLRIPDPYPHKKEFQYFFNPKNYF